MLTYIHIVIYNTSITLVTYFTSSKKFIHASVYICDTARPYVARKGMPLLTFRNYLSTIEIGTFVAAKFKHFFPGRDKSDF